MGQPVVHFEVMGKDAGSLREFYGELFGWKLHPPPESIEADYQTVDREENRGSDGEGGISGGIGAMPDGEDGYATFYVQTDDVSAALAKAEELGGTKMMGPMELNPDLEIALFHDPEGNLIGLVRAEQPS